MPKLPKTIHDEKSFGIPPSWIFLLGRFLKESVTQHRVRCLLELFARLHCLRITQRMNPRPITRTRRTPTLPFRERPEDIRPADMNAVLTPFPRHVPPPVRQQPCPRRRRTSLSSSDCRASACESSGPRPVVSSSSLSFTTTSFFCLPQRVNTANEAFSVITIDAPEIAKHL